MYYLHPTPEWNAFRRTPKPQQKLDANGQPMFERFPRAGLPARPLLDYRILPDTVSITFHRIKISILSNTSSRSAAEKSFGGSSCGGGWILECTGTTS